MFDENATTLRTLRNIRKTLSHSLEHKYDKKDTLDNFLAIHGLAKENFDFINTLGSLINSQLNDVSIDENSNKNEKTIEGLCQEAIAPVKKAMGYDYLYRQIEADWGKREAKRLTGELYDFSLGLSDSTSITIPYCWALDSSKIVVIGRDFGQLASKPAKRWSSYVSALCETIHQISNHVAGAVATAGLFLDIAHLGIFKMGISLDQLKTDPKIRKDLENEYQQFVHSVNHLSRSAVQSPFTNISIFDREKLKTMISQDNYGWYFFNDEFIEVTEEYVLDYIMECQNIFLDFFDKGDVLKGGMPYRFPVVTVQIAKKENGETKIVDQEFLESICKRDIYRYNIFASDGSKCASCCRLLSDTEMLELASGVNSLGGGGMNSLGSHRVVSLNFHRIALECNSYEDFYGRLRSRINDAAKILKSHKNLIALLATKGLQPFITNGYIIMDRLFSTFGVLGLYEANKTLETRFGKCEQDFTEAALILLNKCVNECSKELGIIGNIEQVPGESYAIRLCVADKLLFGAENVPYELYANQFVPLWEEATIWERLETDGKYNKLVTGGGIAHAMLQDPITSVQAKSVINYAVKCGCEHFALNAVYTQFEDGSVEFGKLKFSRNGSKAVDHMTRVVGFFTPVSSWSKVRRNWEFDKRTFVTLSDKLTD